MRTLICCTAVLLAGCGSWQRPGTDEVRFQQDSRQCETEAVRTYPPTFRVFGGGHDDNSSPRHAYYSTCLKSLGYEWRMH